MTDIKHRVLTEVSATVEASREVDLVRGFRQLLTEPVPDGLLRTELLSGGDGTWRIQTLWRDRSALEAMRARPEPPAAPTLFLDVGAEPALRIFDVEVGHPQP